MHTTPQAPARLFFLDWLRIVAFFVLILYHVGMYYVSWDWHVKSVAASPAPEPFMLLSAPWRLNLLFLVSGVASSCMLARTSIARFLGRRSVRLLVPLVFGMLVVVPPQSYFEVVEKVAYAGGYGEFMVRYLGRYHGFCRGSDCLVMPTWNHLWFVAYLWVYTLALAAVVALLGPRFDEFAARAGRLLTGWKIVLLPAAVLAAARVLLAGRYPQNHAIVGDWYCHASYFFVFLLGALLGRVPQSWPRLERLRWPALGMASAGWIAMVMWWALPDNAIPAQQLDAWVALMRSVNACFGWCAIVAACGFAHRHLQHDGAARRYLTEAIFPVYIAHQTLIVVVAHLVKPLHLAPGLEALLLVVMTVTGSFAIFELVRQSAILRPLFGLAPQAKQRLAALQPA
jgi:hypothetical protein